MVREREKIQSGRERELERNGDRGGKHRYRELFIEREEKWIEFEKKRERKI